MRKRIYVAGPYSSDNVLGVLNNIRRGIEMAAVLTKLGFAPYVPFADCLTVIAHGEGISVPELQAVSFAYVSVCDAMILLPGWEKSRGTEDEMEEAWRHSIPVFVEIKDLMEWSGKH